MRYVAARFIDLYRPGDEIPTGRYEAEALSKMLDKGHIVAVSDSGDSAQPPAEAAPAAPDKPKKSRKGQ